MLVSFLCGLIGAALVECAIRFMDGASVKSRCSLFESSVFIISIAVGVALANQIAQHFDSEWKRGAMYVLTVAVTVAVGQVLIHFYRSQQHTQTDRA